MGRIRLLTQGDDFGSSASATKAILEAHEFGWLRNASIMVPCMYFEEAAKAYASHPTLVFGLHCTLNAEWDRVKWGPVLPPESVPSLVDDKGYFLSTTAELHRRNPSIDEIMAELNAQLARAREAGFRIVYVDTHMRFEWVVPELEYVMAQWCRTEGLIWFKPYERMLQLDPSIADERKKWRSALQQAAEEGGGTYLWLGHPAYDDAEIRNLGFLGLTGEQVARERDGDRTLMQQSWLKALFLEFDVEWIGYDEL